MPDAPPAGLDFLQSLLCYDPALRASASETLQHAWFDDAPRAPPLHLMPAFDLPAAVGPPAGAPKPPARRTPPDARAPKRARAAR